MRLLVKLVAPLAITVAAAIVPSPAVAIEHQIVTLRDMYWAPTMVIVAGDSLTHTNQDSEDHDLISDDLGPDGEPWFDSALIGTGQSASVPVEDVPPGSYSYTCSIHPFMRGKLEIREATPPAPAGSGEVEVTSPGQTFAPKVLTVSVGTTVRWRNTSNEEHTVTARDGSWDSSPACPTTDPCWKPGETFSHTFNSAGSFPYYCKLHGTPSGGGHAGTIKVVPAGSKPTSVTSISADTGAGQVSVAGSASFGGQSPVAISADPAGDGPVAAVDGELGVDLVGAKVYQPDASVPALYFEWYVSGMPSSGSLPETVRYTLPFRTGTTAFQLQAKLTDLASPDVADDPSGHAASSGNAFELRGSCGAVGPLSVSSCAHIAWLNGSFDRLHDLIRVKVPLGVTPELVAGAVLERNQSPASDLVRIQAGYQAVGMTAVDDAEWGGETAGFTYRIPQREVLLGIAPAGTAPSDIAFSDPATVGSDGTSYSGTLAAPGPGSWDVWAKACFGASCAARSIRVTV